MTAGIVNLPAAFDSQTVDHVPVTMLDVLEFPSNVFDSGEEAVGLAFDLGGTLIKIAYRTPSDDPKVCVVKTRLFSRQDINECITFLTQLKPYIVGKVVVTGIRILEYRERISNALQKDLEETDEFSCFVKCFQRLVRILPKGKMVQAIPEKTIIETETMVQKAMKGFHEWAGSVSKVEFPMSDPTIPDDYYKWTRNDVDEGKPYFEADAGLYPCFLVLVCSACGIIKIEADGSSQMLAFINRCGKTMQSMAALFLGVKDYTEMMSLAEAGTNAHVDLMKSDMDPSYFDNNDSARTLDEEYVDDPILYGYGKAIGKDVGDFRKEDIMRTIVCHVISDLSQIIAYKAQSQNVQRVFFAGNLVSHPLIRHEFTRNLGYQRTAMPKSRVEYNFLLNGGHYGALGAFIGKTKEVDASN